ncbi:MAG: cysteine desulfurase [Parachlamydiales bacterium]|nr:cysteine desulfurase [Parachlamydiales bacterium]
MEERIYLDNNATTQLDPRVFKAMLLDLSGPPANPSSVHAFGQRAKGLLSKARAQTASFFGAKPEEILFTSGGTESINYFLRGLSGHIITTSIEHSAIYKTLQASKLEVTELPVGLWGAPLPEQIEEALRPNTSAIILSASNGETGVKIDLESIAQIAYNRHMPLFIDAVSYIGKEPFVLYPGVTAVALSAHKFHGPKGIGALYLRSSLKLRPEITGGAQEMGRRAGTENLAGILGLGEALDILKESQAQITTQLLDLRIHFESELVREIPDIAVNGLGPRISNTTNIAFLGCDGETLLMQLDLAGIAVSHGSACSSGSLEPSRVLINMGIDRKTARSSIRFSLSRLNTREEIDIAVEKTAQIVKKLRKMSS